MTAPAMLPAELRGSELRSASLGVGFKLAYGSGALVDGISTGALTYFLLFYLTSVCGLSGTAAGTALLIGLLVDAVGDPVIGLLSDNTRSRTGRRYPYLIWSILPLGLLFTLLFSIPTWLHGLGLLVYAAICAMALRVTLSIYNLPYVSVGAEVTEDYHDRSSVAAYRVTFSMFGVFLVIGLGLGVFLAGPNGLLERQSYIWFGASCALFMMLGGYIAARATRHVLPRLHSSHSRPDAAVVQFLREMSEIFRNRSFVLLFLATVAYFVGQGVAGSLLLYLNRYFWGLTPGSVQLVLVAATIGPFVGAPIAAYASKRFEKKSILLTTFFVFVFAQFWPPVAKIAGVMTASGDVTLAILCANSAVGGAALAAVAISAQSMMADAADEQEFLFGYRREGLFFSGLTLAVKAATGLGGFIAGAALDLIHFPTNLAKRGGDMTLDPVVIKNLGLVAGPLPAAITLLAPLALFGYRLSRKRHAVMLVEMEQRRKPRSKQL